MKRLALLLVLLLAAAPARADAPRWSVDPDRSAITFDVKQMSGSFQGRFHAFAADIVFDPADPASGKVSADIDIASARTGAEDRDRTLQTPAWFDAARFPKARFVSTGFTATGPDSYEARGTLEIRGISQNLTFPFKLVLQDSDKGAEAHMTAAFTLDRSAWQLGTGDWADPTLIANDVAVTIDLRATRQ